MTTKASDNLEHTEWFGAEGEFNGKPILLRGRKFLSHRVPVESFRHLLVVRYIYKIMDKTALPTKAQYDEISRFEIGVIDPLEKEGCGLLTFTETNGGSVRYYFYVRDVDLSIEFINARIDGQLSLEFTCAEDSGWNTYQKRIDNLK